MHKRKDMEMLLFLLLFKIEIYKMSVCVLHTFRRNAIINFPLIKIEIGFFSVHISLLSEHILLVSHAIKGINIRCIHISLLLFKIEVFFFLRFLL